MKTEIWNIIVSGSIYTLLMIGLSLLFWREWLVVCRRAFMRSRLHARRKEMEKQNPVKEHIGQLMQATLGKPWKPEGFFAISIWLCLMMSFISLRSFSPLTALMIGIMSGMMPYFLLRIRLETLRKKGSREGEKVASELLRQYRICDRNIDTTMERLIPNLGDCKVSQKQLFRLLMALRNTGSKKEMKKAADVFAFSIGTNWSHMLAGSIRIAAEKGFDISMGLEDVLLQMRQARVQMEERKRLNSEAARMTVFLIPILYLSTVWLSVSYLELSPSRFLKNQIGTPEGLLLLLFSGFLFIINLAVMEMVGNQRLDF